MTPFWKNTISSVLALFIVAAGGGVIDIMCRVTRIETISNEQNARLARVEQKIDQLAGQKTIASNNQYHE